MIHLSQVNYVSWCGEALPLSPPMTHNRAVADATCPGCLSKFRLYHQAEVDSVATRTTQLWEESLVPCGQCGGTGDPFCFNCEGRGKVPPPLACDEDDTDD